MVAFFVDGVRVIGLPPSIGQIYGLLFISRQPLALDDLVKRLEMSKGSVSQGLRTLKTLGAVREVTATDAADRKTYYEPAVELKRLVGGFIREQILPHLLSGTEKAESIRSLAANHPDQEQRTFLINRISRLDKWMRSGRRMLPIIQRILGE